MSKPTRPVLRWHGGKWVLAPWIISHFPPHRCYVEPFGGAASVLIRKERSYAEVYNDLDGEVVNLFEVLRSPSAGHLIESLKLTPFSETEFKTAYDVASDPIERARRTVIKSFMGFGSNSVHVKSGFRSDSNRSGTTPARDWRNFPVALAAVVGRLRGVVVMNRDACDVMSKFDGPETLHYVDPPYLPETRDKGRDYAFEMSTFGHDALLAHLNGLEGHVVLSGYPSDSYDSALAGWRRVQRKALADGAKKRTEVLWIKPSVLTNDNEGVFA